MISRALRRIAVVVPAIACCVSLAAPAGAAPKTLHRAGHLPVPPAPSGSATHHSGCTISTHTPATVGIDRPLKNITIALGFSGCDTALYYGQNSAVGVLDSAGQIAGYFEWPDEGSMPLTDSIIGERAGSYRTDSGYADLYEDSAGMTPVPVTWQYSSMRVKFSTRSALSAVRKGSTVTFGGYIKRYNPNAYDFTGYASKTVYLQKQTSRGWVTIRTAHGAANGALTASYPSAAAGNYRWMTPEAAQTWSALSNVKRI